MNKTIKLTDSLTAEIIMGDITQFEKVAGSSMYTTIYCNGTSVRIGSDVPCEAGWKFKACVLHYKYHKEPLVFWYEVQDKKRVFPDQVHYISVDELIDQKYGEVFHCDTKKGRMNLISVLIGIGTLVILGLITGKMLIGMAAGFFVAVLLLIINAVKPDFSLKQGWPQMYELLKKLSEAKAENL